MANIPDALYHEALSAFTKAQDNGNSQEECLKESLQAYEKARLLSGVDKLNESGLVRAVDQYKLHAGEGRFEPLVRKVIEAYFRGIKQAESRSR